MNNKNTQENVVKHSFIEFSIFHAIFQLRFSIKSVSLHWMKGTLFWTEPIFEHSISRTLGSFNLVLGTRMIILASVHWRKINGINFSHYETFTNTCTCILKIWLNHNKLTLKFAEHHSWTPLYNPHAVTDYLKSEKCIVIRIVSWSKYRDTYRIVRWVYRCSPSYQQLWWWFDRK